MGRYASKKGKPGTIGEGRPIKQQEQLHLPLRTEFKKHRGRNLLTEEQANLDVESIKRTKPDEYFTR